MWLEHASTKVGHTAAGVFIGFGCSYRQQILRLRDSKALSVDFDINRYAIVSRCCILMTWCLSSRLIPHHGTIIVKKILIRLKSSRCHSESTAISTASCVFMHLFHHLLLSLYGCEIKSRAYRCLERHDLLECQSVGLHLCYAIVRFECLYCSCGFTSFMRMGLLLIATKRL